MMDELLQLIALHGEGNRPSVRNFCVLLVWLVLSDEQMSKRWPFSLLNDEQMSNWVGVKHLPVVESPSHVCLVGVCTHCWHTITFKLSGNYMFSRKNVKFKLLSQGPLAE